MPRKESSGSKKVEKKQQKKPKVTLKNKAVSKSLVKKTKKTTSRKVSKKTSKAKIDKPKAVTQKLPKKHESKKEKKIREVALEQLFRKPATENESDSILTTLPSRMSLRSIEKAKIIKYFLTDEMAEKVRRGAYGLSFAFLLLGASFTGLQLHQKQLGPANLSANLIETSQEAIATTSNTTTQSPNTVPTPELRTLTDIPSKLQEEFSVRFELLYSEKVEIVLRNVETGNKQFLGTEQLGDTTYSFIIPAAGLPLGKYAINALVHTVDARTYDFKIDTFEVPQILQENISSGSETITSDENLVAEGGVTNLDSTNTTSTATAIQENSNLEVKKEDIDNFALYISSDVLVESKVLILQVPSDVINVAVYAQKENSFTPQFIGMARKEFATWRIFLDIKNIPNGRYDLFVKGERSGFEVRSRSRRIEIEKPPLETIQTLNTNTTQPVTASSPEDPAAEAESVQEPILKREFSELSLAPEISDNIETEQIVTELLRNQKSDLEILLRNYSVAVQSGDEIAIRLATEAITQKRTELKTSDRVSTEALGKELDERFDSLQERIRTFEELRRSRNNNQTAKDTDGDGISDFDEEALFKTDPENPDSDEDGVLDGVEILRGYNPKRAASEAVLLYESPKETIGLTQPEELAIHSVNPYVEMPFETEMKKVQAVISGRGLPNSYITLYVFSTPTIVTVKTDDTGSFSYTFSNELEDGTHEVYVAITDNAGAIIAQSEPFSFVKQAEAFTAGTAVDSRPLVQPLNTDNSYGIALGLGVLALGIVLLMLGIGLRRPTPELA